MLRETSVKFQEIEPPRVGTGLAGDPRSYTNETSRQGLKQQDNSRTDAGEDPNVVTEDSNQEVVTMIHTHETAPTQFVEADGIRFAYRRFGKPSTIPLLFLGYYNSNMDGWDPDVTNSLAADHEVILFDNAGVGASGGKTPHVVAEMTKPCVALCRALGLK